ncbi:hypothetical protein B296_00007705 [Ensete ventricosum]|uniref:CRAL/TRIO N-terminal domain-containing protein n=1 Tax=Ensete ventricosum TaxID=4639 RepID=A0A426ZHC0_ENSVE|nr:hypothetical protein B296_00007705 [Ensete ventricosum]
MSIKFFELAILLTSTSSFRSRRTPIPYPLSPLSIGHLGSLRPSPYRACHLPPPHSTMIEWRSSSSSSCLHDFNMGQAHDMLLRCAEWRCEFDVDRVAREELVRFKKLEGMVA